MSFRSLGDAGREARNPHPRAVCIVEDAAEASSVAACAVDESQPAGTLWFRHCRPSDLGALPASLEASPTLWEGDVGPDVARLPVGVVTKRRRWRSGSR